MDGARGELLATGNIGGVSWLLRYSCLFCFTTLVNKYVLSVMLFTYPTIFQSWQTLAGAITLRLLQVSNLIQETQPPASYTAIAFWLPGMMLFVASIYSGSVTLSRLSIPAFMCVQNLTTATVVFFELFERRKVNVPRYLMLMLVLVSPLFIARTDPQYSTTGYNWAAAHFLSMSAYLTYEKIYNYYFTLSDISRLHCNFVYSLIVLVPCSYFLGDLTRVVTFPFWHWYRFYVGCFCSGLFGVFVSVSNIELKKSAQLLTPEQSCILAKVLTVLVSIMIFPVTLNLTHSFWLFVNLVSSAFALDAVTTVNTALPVFHMGRTDIWL